MSAPNSKLSIIGTQKQVTPTAVQQGPVDAAFKPTPLTAREKAAAEVLHYGGTSYVTALGVMHAGLDRQERGEEITPYLDRAQDYANLLSSKDFITFGEEMVGKLAADIKKGDPAFKESRIRGFIEHYGLVTAEDDDPPYMEKLVKAFDMWNAPAIKSDAFKKSVQMAQTTHRDDLHDGSWYRNEYEDASPEAMTMAYLTQKIGFQRVNFAIALNQFLANKTEEWPNNRGLTQHMAKYEKTKDAAEAFRQNEEIIDITSGILNLFRAVPSDHHENTRERFEKHFAAYWQANVKVDIAKLEGVGKGVGEIFSTATARDCMEISREIEAIKTAPQRKGKPSGAERFKAFEALKTYMDKLIVPLAAEANRFKELNAGPITVFSAELRKESGTVVEYTPAMVDVMIGTRSTADALRTRAKYFNTVLLNKINELKPYEDDKALFNEAVSLMKKMVGKAEKSAGQLTEISKGIQDQIYVCDLAALLVREMDQKAQLLNDGALKRRAEFVAAGFQVPDAAQDKASDAPAVG